MTSRIRQLLDEGQASDLADAIAQHAEQSRLTRLLFHLAGGVFPVGGVLSFLHALEHNLGRDGIGVAAAACLAECRIAWGHLIPPETADQLRESPLVLYGEHGSILTPLLCAAALGRSDLKLLGMNYLRLLDRRMNDFVLPLWRTWEFRARTEIRKGFDSFLAESFMTSLDDDLAKPVARRRNLESLASATGHVVRGGAILILPEGRDPRTGWQNGLGYLVRDIARCDGGQGAQLVPLCIHNDPPRTVYRRLFGSRLCRALLSRGEIRVEFGSPIALDQVAGECAYDPSRIVRHLEQQYPWK